VLKAGLRLLNERWNTPESKLIELPKSMMRAGLFRDLLTGKIRLQSVVGNDVSAAQHDVKLLTLPQLLRLRTLHLDFTPSGCGADTVTAVGGTHEAFLSTLDSLLFQQLGQKALSPPSATSDSTSKAAAKPTSDAHQCGREAILFLSAAAALPTPCWWCWWLPSGSRVFFNAGQFASATQFSETAGGVLEVTDFSKADRHDPTGRLMWMDWKAEVVTEEAKLSSEPKRALADSTSDASVGGAAAGSAAANNGPGSPERAGGGQKEAPAAASVGSATAGMVNPELLRSMRGGLRKTGTLERQQK